jgi:hypothetical protein
MIETNGNDKANGPPKRKELYFNPTSFTFRFLRTLNLLEPGRPVISLSKFLLVLMMFITVWTVVNNPENVVAVMACLAANAITLLNYGYRRHVQNRNGHFELEKPEQPTTLPPAEEDNS